MPEALLILACLSEKGCAETASAYRNYNAAPFERLDYYADYVSRATAANYWAPIAVYAAGREGSVKLTARFSLQLKQGHSNLLYSYNF